jgi:hypothetical protein
MSERTFFGVLTPEQASSTLWPAVSVLVAQAIPYGRGEYTLEDIHEGLRRGEMLAVAKVVDRQVEFVLTCVVAVFPRKRVLYVQYGAGRGGADLKEKLIEVARALKCDWIETRCRESVARLCRRSGFETGYQVCILEV